MEQFYDYDSIKFEKLFNENNLTNYGLAASSFGEEQNIQCHHFLIWSIFLKGDIAFF